MTHRGAVGSDARDGDGAGVMTSIPHKFFIKNFARETGFDLPPQGQYAAGNLFFKPDTEMVKHATTSFEETATSLGLRTLGWREVPRDSSLLGPAALSREPIILQPFVVLASAYGEGNKPELTDPELFDEIEFERKLYVLRKAVSHDSRFKPWFYVCSLSNKNIVYKGQLAPVQVYQYYHDLVSVDYEGHFALVHSRFSTNTFPSWDRSQPLRWLAHNGEINTLRGNKNWMRAREGVLKSEFFGEELEKLFPIVEEGGSDSAAFDNVLELLVMNRVLSLPEAIMMMVPEAWQGNAAIEPERVIQKGRLQPGKMLLVDTIAGRIIDDAELKHTVSTRQNFQEWLNE